MPMLPDTPGFRSGMSDPRTWRECERCDRVNCECREREQQQRIDDMFAAAEEEPWKP